MDEKVSPLKRFKIGAINASIWSNIGQKDGKEFEFKTVSFERRYKDKDGEWKSTSSLRPSDLPKASLVLNKAFEYISFTDNTTPN
ncbi:hypothetical protein HOK51_10240 [Candidatus Woesearchaeota archaeon]|jgi:hypothetical protein|nr:hypothetical protein [Candidatus Woesearchaeota archaeon]MBT6520203.1 hypothetical protein [Candidatus Woesearchaeota archaeon]MBT7367214.1 hypothetical protein [Candidatus Woesearchaeota archaeon]